MTLRIGLLAASRIADLAVVEPAGRVERVELTAVGARDLERAQHAAARWGIRHAYGSYAELVTAPEVDAVYIATPASLHREWAIAAIEAGKHVLCEKPLAANAADGRLIADAARASDVVVMEAFHWRYHPYASQIRTVLESGELGALQRVEAAFELPEPEIPRDDIRWDLALGGGATMDLGCYSIQWARFAGAVVGGGEPEVVSAEAVIPVDGIDGSLRAELRWPSGLTGAVRSSMILDGDQMQAWLKVAGAAGTLVATNVLAPQFGGAVMVVDTTGSGGGVRTIAADASSTTYYHQLLAFRDAIEHGVPFPTTADDGVRNMGVIDACYLAAGLPVRPSA
jgi:predicted dehydrogenase